MREMLYRSNAILLIVWFALATCTQLATNTIVTENSRPGSNQWWYKQNNDTPIAQGYATRFSYLQGDTVSMKISSLLHIASYTVTIYRMGYYGGRGARFVENVTVRANKQPACYFELSSRMTDCSNWETSMHWKIPADSVSGIYIALPVHHNSTTERPAYGTYIPFVVRQSPNSVGSELLFKTSDLTWVAYNKYGNWNVYRGNGSFSPDSRAFKASYNRPWQNRFMQPEGHSSNFLFGAEFSMLYWLEKQGYDVSYCSCQDIEDMHRDSVLVPSADSQRSPPYRVLLSVGHDEYWTQEMKNAFEHARENGVHLAFFSGNENNHTHHTAHVAPMMLDHTTQRVISLDSRRIVVCRKDTINSTAPASAADWTGTFRDPRHRPPEDESLLSGQWFMVNAHRRDAVEVTREDATLRFWRNTSFYQVSSIFSRLGGAANHSRNSHASATAGGAAGKHNNSAAENCAYQRLHHRKSHRSDDLVYISAAGILGYEWDAFPIHSRPPGLIPLSTTRIHVPAHLVQDFGAAYKGNGYAMHRLSLYRHYSHRSPASAQSTSATLEEACSALKSDRVPPKNAKGTVPRTSLVFGTGTIQWSWALTEWHDGYHLPEDRDLQQATLNVLADMGVFPTTLTSPSLHAHPAHNTSCVQSAVPLTFPVGSTDTTPPISTIASVDLRAVSSHISSQQGLLFGLPSDRQSVRDQHRRGTDSKRRVLKLRGTAEDVGGHVAAVEVSLNGGRTWHMATGRKHWTFTHHFLAHHRVDHVNNTLQKPQQEVSELDKYRESLYYKEGFYNDGTVGSNATILITTRAVDDSGWIEQVDILSALCQSKQASGSLAKRGSSDIVRDKRILARNAILIRL